MTEITENQRKKIIKVEQLEKFAELIDTLYGSTMGASGSNHAPGQVPDPGPTAGTSKFLREDGTWLVPEGGGGSGSVPSNVATLASDGKVERSLLPYYVSTTGDAVDMGLPSGVLWSSCYLGANSPEQRGLYFSWGNVTGHYEGDGYTFISSNYTNTPGSGLTGTIPTNTTYDAARAIWGSTWRIPTKTDWDELYNNCEKTVITSLSGVRGVVFTSNINGASIFFKCESYAYSTGLDFFLMSLATQYDNTYCYLVGNSSQSGYFDKFRGFLIRPVADSIPEITYTDSKVDKVSNATTNNLAALTYTGNIEDSGINKNSIQPKLTVVSQSNTSFTAAVDKYYNISGSVGTMTITLPSMTDNTKTAGFIVSFTTGSSPALTISGNGKTVSYFSNYSIAANKTYELNFMYNGTKWIVAYGTVG